MRCRYAYRESDPEDNICTVADGGDQAVLLFYRKVWGPTDLQELAKEPTVPEVVGSPFLLFPTPEGHVLAGSYGTSEFLSLLRDFDASTTYVEYDRNGEARTVRPMEVYNACGSPLKYAIRCDECLLNKSQTRPQCTYAKYREGEPDTHEGWTAEEVYNKWTSRKTKVGKFTYVGPGLTSSEYIDSALRPPGEHDFRYVAANSLSKREGRAEYKRHTQFKQEACSNCFIKEECWEHAGEGYGKENYIRYCQGNYSGTEYETAREIISNVWVPYTHKQILYLLKNSGELYRRYNRRKYFATFTLPNRWGEEKALSFGLVRVTNPGYGTIPFGSFQEAKEFLDDYSNPAEPRESKLSLITKATLIELATMNSSPRYRNGWRSTSYPALGITYREWGRALTLHYRSRSWTVPWTTTAKDLRDIFVDRGAFVHARKDLHELRKFKY